MTGIASTSSLSGAPLVYFGLLAAAVVTAIVVRLWRGTPAILEARRIARNAWVFPLAWLDAISRALIPVYVLMGTAFLSGLFLELGARTPSQIASPVAMARLGKVTAVLTLVGTFVVVLPIVLFNQPKFLVPRGLRKEPGLFMVGMDALRRIFSPRRR